MQGKLDEARAALIREKEATKIAIEQAPPLIKEILVVDNTKLELLKSQNEELEVISKDADNLFSKLFIIMLPGEENTLKINKL